MSFRPVGLVPLFVLTGCEHSTPFSTGPTPATGPLSGGTPTRLTFNTGTDERAAWLPDGSAFLYTQERADLPQDERCLASMDAAGGTVTGTICASLEASQDSQITFESAAVSPALRLGYVRAGTIDVGATGFNANALLIATLFTPTTTRVLLRTPFFGPNSLPVDNVSQVQWLGDTSLFVLGEREIFPVCLGCAPDTIRSGLEIDRVDIGADSTRVSYVPGTDSASSVAVGRGDTIYYTRNGLGQIFVQSLSVGVGALFRDYGPGVIVRDVRVAGSRFVAVTGGQVTQFVPDPTNPGATLQRDHGGDLRFGDVANGTDITLTMQNAFARRPVISSDGRQVVFERYPYVINVLRAPDGTFLGVDTVVSHTADLWSVQWP
jgi:hypothetical protein